MIKLNYQRDTWVDCHTWRPDIFFSLTCTLFIFFFPRSLFFFPYSSFSFLSFVSLVCDQHFMYVFSCLVFFSFYLSVPFPFSLVSCSPFDLTVSTLALYLKLSISIYGSFFSIYLTFFFSFPFSFLSYLSHPLLSDISQSLPLFLPPSLPLTPSIFPTAKPVTPLGRGRFSSVVDAPWNQQQPYELRLSILKIK